MISPVLLPILGILFSGSTALRFDSDETLRAMVRDPRGHVYLGAVNALYQLNDQLEILNKTITGPVQDNPNCAPPQLEFEYCFDDIDTLMRTTDNYNQLLLIDEVAGHLVACGNVFQGTCEARMLQDITFTIPESESFMPESYVVSTDKKLKSVGFIAEVSGEQSMFIGGYVFADGEFTTDEGKKAGIANRQLVNFQETDNSFTFFTDTDKGLYVQRSWHPKPFVDVTYVSAFSNEQFAYFFFHEKSRSEDGRTETRVARTCLSDKGNTKSPLSDSTYTSYIEIALTCSYENENYPALTGVKLASVQNFYSGDVTVLVGTFSNQRNATKTAICSFSFDEINRMFNDKVTSCASGQGVKRIKSEALKDAQVPCTNSKTTCDDVCTCNIKNDNYPLEVVAPLASSSAVMVEGDVVALATNVVEDQVEVFVGVTRVKVYNVLKYVLESVDRVHLISDYSNESLSSKVLQIEVLKEQKEILILTENSVYTKHISVCDGYVGAGCQQCLLVKDPHCGWCEMSGTCTTEETCTTDVWRTAGQCTSITGIEPNMMSMGTQRTSNKVTITTNNKYPVGTPLQCDFGKYGVKDATITDQGDISCNIPYLNPEIEGKHVIDVAIVSSDVILANSEEAFTFFNCQSYDTCSTCTQSAVGCGWCIYANTCLQTCHKTTLPEQCPALTYTKSFVPAQFPHRLEIVGVNLPKPFGDDGASYQCIVTIAGEETRLPATYLNTSKLVCATNHTFDSPQTAGQIIAPVKVIWENKEVEAVRAPELDIYRCNILGQDCSACRANSMLRSCGWCDELSQCLLQDGGYQICPNSYSSVCTGLTVEGFEPKHGPLEGGTMVTIHGSNLGSRPSDITSIKIAGLNCQVQGTGFEVSRTVVCRTSSSDTVKHGLLEVTTSGDQYIYPTSMFYYKRYKVENVLPRCSIAAGGTLLTVTGDQLNIGRQVSIIVAGNMCDVVGKPTSKQVLCTTRSSTIGKEKLQVKIDGGSSFSPMLLEVVANPTPLSISGNSSILAGGISVNVNFSPDYRLDCVQRLQLILQSVSRVNGEGECSRSGPSTFTCHTPPMAMLTDDVSYVNAHLEADNHIISLEPFTIYSDPVIKAVNNTNTDGFIEWPIGGSRELVLNGQNLNTVHGIEVHVGGYKVLTKVTNDHIVLTPPEYSVLKEYRALQKKGEATRDKREGSRTKRDESRDVRETDDDVIEEPQKRSHELSSEYIAPIVVKLGKWEHVAGKLYYTTSSGGGIPYVAIVIPIAGFIVLVVLLTYVGLKYHRSQRSHRRTLKEVRMHMEKLEMRVANECKDAFTALQTHLTDLQGSDVEIPFRPFSDFMANVLFPGTEVETRDLLARLSAPTSKVTETPQLAQFRRLLKDREFLQKFVEVVEADPHFDVAHKCKMASLLVITSSSDMKYLTEVLFILMERLIDKFLAKKNHPQLLLRRTESVADKLLTHWLNYCCYQYLRQHAGKSIFTLFSAIKQQLDLGPQDEITYEAKSSLNNEKMLRETIEFKLLNGTVRDLNKNEHSVTLLTCDSIKQAKRKVIESVHRNKPASQIPAIESFDLMYIRSGNTPVILREDKAPIIEGWRKLNTLSDYNIETNSPVFAMIPLSTDSEHSSISPQTERRKASFLTSKRYRSKGNLISAGLSSETEKSEDRHQVFHLIKPNHDICETDTLLSTKMMSEVFLTRLLSTKGTLQPYVDDLFNSVFMARDRVPACIKYLFDFLERQAQRHNVAHNQAYIHTWKNNSLSLRFWMNVLKNPHFLLDISQTPTIDSSLNIVCGVFMDSCSTSDKGLTKDSPINKLLYAKDIPRYKKQVQIHYEQVSTLPRPNLDFLTGLTPTGLNTTVAVSELLDIAKKYQKQLQTSFGPDSPSLNLKFTSVIDPNLLTAHNMV